MGYLKSCALRSGSSGNSILISSPKSLLLVDAGITGKGLESGLKDLGEDIEKLKGILITHEHSDHISGLGVILRRYKLPFYINIKTLEAALPQLGDFDPNLVKIIHPQEKFSLDDLEISSFPVSHDAADPVGFTVRTKDGSVGIVTDLGCTNEEIFTALAGVDICYLEANYDQDMLKYSSYPLRLKERIASHYGHLSNEQSGLACIRLLKQGTSRIVLSHLSNENNFPHLALLTVNDSLTAAGAVQGKDYQLTAARRYELSEPQQI